MTDEDNLGQCFSNLLCTGECEIPGDFIEMQIQIPKAQGGA